MSGWRAALGLCQREAQPTQNYQFFHNLCQFKKNYITLSKANFGG